MLRESLRPGWHLLLLVVFWVLVAYLVLPRLHRILTQLYLPGYFIGRTRTSDGLLGDPVNLALLGDEAQIHAAMARAGWTRADEVDLASSLRIIGSTLSRRSYPRAPVSPLHLFDRQQDFAYQQEVAGNPSQRHHVRFWRCPEGWRLPGGFPVDWLAAGTYDRSVGLSLITFQVTHKIAEDIDVERDHIVASLTGGRAGRGGRGDPELLQRLPRPQRRRRRDRHGRRPARRRPPAGRAADRPGRRDAHGQPRPAAGADLLRGRGRRRPRGWSTCCSRCPAGTRLGRRRRRCRRCTARPRPARRFVLAGVSECWTSGSAWPPCFGRNWSRLVLMLLSVTAVVVAFVGTTSGRPAAHARGGASRAGARASWCCSRCPATGRGSTRPVLLPREPGPPPGLLPGHGDAQPLVGVDEVVVVVVAEVDLHPVDLAGEAAAVRGVVRA